MIPGLNILCEESTKQENPFEQKFTRNFNFRSNSIRIIMATVAACYAVCGTAVTACFTVAGFTFGTVPGAQIAAVPALAACNSQFAICETACMAAAGVEAVATVGLAGAAMGAFPVVAVVIGTGYFLRRWWQ